MHARLEMMTGRSVRSEDDEVGGAGLGRILALSDGVFAIALTLLVLQFKLPAGYDSQAVGKDLVDLGHYFFAYALSFWVIGRFWYAHHLSFRYIARYDAVLITLNLSLLFFVAFLPFPTPFSAV